VPGKHYDRNSIATGPVTSDVTIRAMMKKSEGDDEVGELMHIKMRWSRPKMFIVRNRRAYYDDG
jgi:hypothetical protein